MRNVASLVCLFFVASPSQAADWPQLGQNPQHTGFQKDSDQLKPPFSLEWNVQFQPERLYPALQPVVADGRVFLGTESGNFYAISAKDGSRLWKFPAAEAETIGPITHTAGLSGGRVFVGSMDGCVYALDADDGALVWRFNSQMRTGFSAAVLLADGKVFIPNRGGTLFALEQVDGRVAWKADFNTGLLQSPAYDDGRVYVAGMDMCLYAVNASTGRTVWKTDRMEGLACKDYWPVVYHGLVIVRPMGPWKAAVFDEQTGRPVELTIPGGITMNGAVAPPCIDGQGKLVTAEDGGWARIDVETGQAEHISEKRDASGRRPGGTGNRDENMIASAAGDLIFVMHCEEGNAQFTGCYELDTRRWTPIRGGPWLNLISNTQGGGASQAVAAAGRLFHVSLHGLRCFEGETAR